MSNLTKRDLAVKVTDRLGSQGQNFTQQEVFQVILALIDEITETLATGENVVMRKFGTFEVREMKAKIGRNPKNPGKDVKIPARAAVKFKPGKELKQKVAGTLKIIRERQ
jgi:DNA-binding protein HU-beta/integration host factor subunit alpha